MSALARQSRTDQFVGWLVLIAVLALAGFAFSGCASNAPQSGVVGFATVRGDGDARARLDGKGLAIGEVQGEVGLFVPGSGFPLTMPLRSTKGGWVTFDTHGNRAEGKINVDPLPAWIVELYRPGELELVAQRLGYASILVAAVPNP